MLNPKIKKRRSKRLLIVLLTKPRKKSSSKRKSKKMNHPLRKRRMRTKVTLSSLEMSTSKMIFPMKLETLASKILSIRLTRPLMESPPKRKKKPKKRAKKAHKISKMMMKNFIP